ncbi:MAG: DNA-directed RNA polymerase subunit alpha [Gemmatimonadota bacterium]|nr:DNA-directed RNA polymerase subunit alpha [Gemmatimonadota bacterium]MDH5805218.1 DNA-directed RNA polymerase subunit alpha [Gemmatimonadota bacterium]
MKIDLSSLVRPHVVEKFSTEANPNQAEFRLQPLERGFGHTLGNALRRMLLSSLPGAAVWGFRLDGVVHEHQTIPGVVEDIHQIIKQLKSLTLVLDEEVSDALLHLKVEKAGPVRAKDIEPHGSVEIVDPEHILFTLQDDREINGEFYVNRGRGYVDASQHVVDRSMPVDLVRIDGDYNPVTRANFTVAETRVGQRTDFDRLTMDVQTNGTVTPDEAVSYAAALLQEHLKYFFQFSSAPEVSGGDDDTDERDRERLREVLSQSIDDCGLSVRSVNSLKNSNINTLGDLVRHSEEDMLKVKNVGEKALGEIGELLRREGLSFGMEVDLDDDALMASDIGSQGGGL